MVAGPIQQAARAAPPLPAVATWTETGSGADARKSAVDSDKAPTFPEAYPQAAQAYMAYRARLEEFQKECESAPLAAERAQALLDSLYEDQGHPLLTARWQGSLLVYFAAYGSSAKAAADVRGTLHAGLMNFYKAGGGQGDYGDPVLETKLANALLATGIEDDACFAAAENLTRHADHWSAELANPAMRDILDHYQRRQDGISDDLRSRGVHHRAPREDSQFRRAARALDRLVHAASLTEAELSETLGHCLTLGPAAAGEPDALLQAVAACRELLERRPMIRPTLVRTIDRWLLELARADANKLSPAHWQAWSRAVAPLERRVSDDLRRCVREACADAAPSAKRNACCEADARLRQAR